LEQPIGRIVVVALSTEFVEQCLSIFQIGGAETLGEPVVNLGEHGARLLAAAVFGKQLCEAYGRA